MKRLDKLTLAAISVFAIICVGAHALQARSATPDEALDHGWSVKEYEEFHDVLHPLQHEALPKKDFKTIRARAGELVARGDAIIKLGVPGVVKREQTESFKEGLKLFGDALVKFKADAEGGTDAQLEESYSAVHDSFEMLAEMLPRK